MKFIKKYTALILALAIVLALAGCSTNDNNISSGDSTDSGDDALSDPGSEDGVQSTASGSQAGEIVEIDDLLAAVDPDDAVSVSIAEAVADTQVTAGISSVEYSDTDISGDTYNNPTSLTLDDKTVTIAAAGTYVLSGSIAEGQIIVEASSSDKVQLVLDGVTVSCSYGPAIYIKRADKVFITTAAGCTNTLTDGDNYTLAEGDDEPNACIFSKADLTINGSGTLNINGNYNHGVFSKDDLTVTGGTITVSAVNDGLKGKDCVKIYGGTITVTAGGDGIQSINAEDTSLGYISIDGGTLNIISGGDGVQSATALQVTGGTLDITAGGGSAVTASHSAKGLKGTASLLISGGTITINSADDSLHSNGDILITDGVFNISSGDDGVHSDDALVITGGALRIDKSYEGLEGTSITVAGGTVSIAASDDGLNASGGNDASGWGGPMGGGDMFAADSSAYIRITGGWIGVDASGDGLDSNGALYVEGGEVYVSGPTSDGNGALDAQGSSLITGGVVVAAGSAGMAVSFTSDSSQCSLLYSVSGSAGMTVTLRDDSGNVLVSYTPEKEYQTVVISCSSMELNGTYTLTCGSSDYTVTLDSVSTGSSLGGMGGGMGGQDWPNGNGGMDGQTRPGGGGTRP